MWYGVRVRLLLLAACVFHFNWIYLFLWSSQFSHKSKKILTNKHMYVHAYEQVYVICVRVIESDAVVANKDNKK